MITIIHGEDSASSRNHFHEFKSKYPDGRVIQADSITLTDLTQIFDGGDLFSTEKAVFLEGFLTKRKQSTDFDSLLNLIKEHTLHHTIVMWEGKELDRKTLSLFPHATIKSHSLPQTLFQFLDNLKPNNGPQLIQLIHKTTEKTDIELVFYMLIRHIRLLIALKDERSDRIDELKRLAPWQSQKLQRQSRMFTNEQLVSIHTSLYEIEKGMKTGELSTPIDTAIDILLLEI